MRYITLNEDNKVVGIRWGKSIAEGEIESETGELGQIYNKGSFVDDMATPEPTPDPILEKLTAIETRLKAIEEGQGSLRSLSK